MRVEHTLHVEAPPAAVWAVTVDVERWPEWSPTVTSLRRLDGGAFGKGSAARIKQPMQPLSDWVVTQWEEGRRFAWETRRPGLRMTGIHEIEPEGEGTRSRLAVQADGALARLLWPLLRALMRRALEQENGGLRRRCEARDGGRANPGG